MIRKWVILILVVLFVGCSANNMVQTNESPQIANPASVHCIKNNGTLEIRSEDDGQYGICIFPDGSECEEWMFFRGDCLPRGEI